MTTVDTVWRRVDRVLTRRMPGSLLLLVPGRETPLELEGAAVQIWDDLGMPATDEQLVESYAARYPLPAGAIRPGVVETIRALRDYGAIAATDG